MPVSGSGVMLALYTVPARVRNSGPPANLLDETICPFSATVWHSMHPPTVARYSPYFRRLFLSGDGTLPAGCGTLLMKRETGKLIFVLGKLLLRGGKTLK